MFLAAYWVWMDRKCAYAAKNIFKDKNGNFSDISNHRPIATVMIILKILEHKKCSCLIACVVIFILPIIDNSV